jgi:hypothetical protein
MARTIMEIRSAGKTIQVPSVTVNGCYVVALGDWIKIAAVHDEEFLEGQPVDDPELFMTTARQQLGADIFSFTQKLAEPEPQHCFPFEWDNVAALPVTTYDAWINKQVGSDLRKSVRKAEKRGVTVREVEFNDELVAGVTEIYNESAVRQGKAFWHYGKDFNTVKHELATFLDRSIFLGAYFDSELVGFMKMVQVDRLGCSQHIISKKSHHEKRPTNALIAQAVRVCEERAFTHLTYGKYTYSSGPGNSLTDFKFHNGFEKVLVPRYYVPLTKLGKLIMKIGLHHGIKHALPYGMRRFLKEMGIRYHIIVTAIPKVFGKRT